MAENGRGEMRVVPEKTNGQQRFGAVIPAAGMSSRMKAFKPLLPYGKSTVIESTVATVLEAVTTAVVVLGNRADEVEAVLKQRFGDRVTMINDDKPIIRNIDGKFWVCSTPWMGKSEIGTNIDVPIKAVYVLQRGEKNTAERVSTARVFKQLLEATLVPNTAENMQKLLELFDGLFSSVPLFLLSCNTDEEAAQVAYNAANKE